jgi:putative PIN family toxin of toxin-antitoxin system
MSVRVVVDTNVLVSGLLGVYSSPARIIDLVYSGRFQCVHDDRILMEYREVLSRPKFASAISEHERDDLIDFLERWGLHILPGPLDPIAGSAPDPFDLPFAEAAVAGQASCIITGNTAHFDFFTGNQCGIRVLSPKECHTLVCGGALE